MIVFDASAAMAILREEPGCDIAQSCLYAGVISAVNHSEVLAKLSDQGLPLDRALAQLSALDLDVRSFDEAQAIAAADLRPATQGKNISFADRACLAMAAGLKAPVLTSDRIWADLDIGVEVRPIR